MVCFRKHGHNELDDPTFTQPTMYKKVQEFYQENKSHDEQSDQSFRNYLEEQYAMIDRYEPKVSMIIFFIRDLIRSLGNTFGTTMVRIDPSNR